MEQSEIIEGNKLIAEFMDAKLNEQKSAYYLQVGDPYAIGGSRSVYPFGLLKYHSSWDWLMPVIKKIREILQENKIYNKAKIHWGFIEAALAAVEIEAVHAMVIEFIKWYNKSNLCSSTQSKTTENL